MAVLVIDLCKIIGINQEQHVTFFVSAHTRQVTNEGLSVQESGRRIMACQ